MKTRDIAGATLSKGYRTLVETRRLGFYDIRHLYLISKPVLLESSYGAVVKISLIYCLLVYAGGLCAYRFERRSIWIIGSQCIAFVATLATTFGVNFVEDPAKCLFLLIVIGLPCSYFCLPVAWTWLVNSVPANRPKRAACIAIASTLVSMGNFCVIYLPHFDITGEGIVLSMWHFGLLIILEMTAIVVTFILHIIFRSANRWLDRYQTRNPGMQDGFSSWTLGTEFDDQELEFRFLT
ncbi:hypothetical protein F4781DRAFT_356301 [Annulohypoxylon bovei var. microspora]|nr:hypothetical protein F4781DRAFT_356301 [Annulohypoxylon bovei var. microspora]